MTAAVFPVRVRPSTIKGDALNTPRLNTNNRSNNNNNSNNDLIKKMPLTICLLLHKGNGGEVQRKRYS